MEDKAAIEKYKVWGVFLSAIGLFAIAITAGWCWFLGAGNFERASLAFALCSASIAVGGLGGFLFSIFGDEQEQFGKMRDATIALLSGFAGAGVAKANAIGAILGQVHVFEANSEGNSSFSILIVIAYFIAGFFLMYFFRKLALNPALAEAKGAMDRAQTSRRVSDVAGRIAERLSQSMLLGRDFISEVEDMEPDEQKRLDEDLNASDVHEFLAECEKDAKNGISIPPHTVAMAARLQYYRVYFKRAGTQERLEQENTAFEWIQRALMRDPTNPDFQIKLADILGMQERYDEAVSILEKLEREENAPQYIQQWLGYFLLYVEGREKDAIKQSLSYHDRFPDESSGLFNAACGYAQLYGIELEQASVDRLPESQNRLESLRLLQQGIRIDSDLRMDAKKHTEPGDSFEFLKDDADFLKLISGDASNHK